MELRLHKNARTTPAVRAEIAASTEGVSALARRYGVGRGTIYKWKRRARTLDRPHTAHRLQTTMNPAW
jgi:transposase-like protein